MNEWLLNHDSEISASGDDGLQDDAGLRYVQQLLTSGFENYNAAPVLFMNPLHGDSLLLRLLAFLQTDFQLFLAAGASFERRKREKHRQILFILFGVMTLILCAMFLKTSGYVLVGILQMIYYLCFQTKIIMHKKSAENEAYKALSRWAPFSSQREWDDMKKNLVKFNLPGENSAIGQRLRARWLKITSRNNRFIVVSLEIILSGLFWPICIWKDLIEKVCPVEEYNPLPRKLAIIK